MPPTLDELSTEVNQITTFENEGPQQSDDLAAMTSPPEKFLATARETREHTVKDIIGREYYLGTVTWHRADLPTTELFNLQFPEGMLALQPIRDKLSGFAFLRSNVRVRVEINAQPFQQGRLLGVFFPGVTDRTAIRNLTHLTGYHSTEVDIQTAQEMALTIPFVAPVSHINLCKNWGTVGSVAIFVYGQLAGGETDVEIAIWASLVDPDPQVPTAAPLLPISVKTQGLGKERVAAIGPITRVAQAVSGISKVASLIPGIGAAAGVVNTVSSMAANLASTFGWSKPIQEMPAQVMQQNPARYFNNFNGTDNSKVLALDQENAVEQYSGLFGSDVDEMSIQYITQTPNFFRNILWNTTMEAGQYISTIPVHPGIYGVAQLDPGPGTQVYWNPTHLSYVTSVFKLWRGDLLFRFKLVKTKFHSGRIRISYVPQLDAPYNSLPVLDLNRAYSMVVDIRNRSEFDFEVPFVYTQPWADCSDLSNARDETAVSHLGMTGFIVVDVINKLVAPSTLVSPVIDILVEVCAGKNFELAIPKQCYWTPVNSFQPALTPPKEELDEPHLVDLQAFFLETRSETQISDQHSPLFSTQTDLSSADAAALTIGEKIVSLRQLFQRFQQVFTSILPSVPPATVLIQPYAIREINHFVVTPDNDYFSYFMPLFAFLRGGMRIKLRANYDTRMINSVNAYLFTVAPINSDTPIAQQLVAAPDTCLPTTIHFPSLEGIVEVSVPYYNRYPITYNPFYMLPTTTSLYPDPDSWMHANLSYVSIDNVPASNTQPFTIYRAIGEDFSAGFLVGVPLCVDPVLSVP